MENNKFGELHKKLRIEKGYSITALSKLSGVSQPYISQLENGKRSPSPEVLNKLAFAYKMNLLSFRIATGLTNIDEERERLLNKYKKDPVDLIDLLKSEESLLFKGEEISQKDKKRIVDILEALFLKE